MPRNQVGLFPAMCCDLCYLFTIVTIGSLLGVGSLVTVFNRAVILHMVELYEEAVVEYTQALQIQPDNPYAYFNRAASLYALELCEESVEDLGNIHSHTLNV